MARRIWVGYLVGSCNMNSRLANSSPYTHILDGLDFSQNFDPPEIDFVCQGLSTHAKFETVEARLGKCKQFSYLFSIDLYQPRGTSMRILLQV
jgi:hypothetical protein